jgi:transposase
MSVDLTQEAPMRGDDRQETKLFSYISLEERVPKNHPLRDIRRMVDMALEDLSPRFEALYASGGRPSVAPEKLLRALVLQVLFSVRSERQLMEQLDYNLLFRWFVGLNMDDPIWDATVFTKNRDRLLEGEVAQAFFEQVLDQARRQQLLSNEHFTVDGTLIEAWAGLKSFRRKGGRPPEPPDDPRNPTVNFHGEKRRNDTHESTTDPESRLYKKSAGQEAKLVFLGHALTENRNGLVVDTRLTHATGYAERDAALEMVAELDSSHITVGMDKGYDTRNLVAGMRERNATPHVARNTTNRRSAIDGRTTRHSGYAVSQRKRKRIEEFFGWLKTVGLLRKARHRGLARVGWTFTFSAAVFNLIRIRNLTMEPG